jgi:hypothetical protein
VDPTNNFAERMIRFAVLWRKRSQGTCSEKRNAGWNGSSSSARPVDYRVNRRMTSSSMP